MLTFLAYGGDTKRRQLIIDRMEALVRFARLANGQHDARPRVGLIEALADGTHDLATAFENSGFTAPLLQICGEIFNGLPTDEAPPFALALVRSARIDSDIGDVPQDFLKWMFEKAVAELGASRIRSTTREAGHPFNHLAEAVYLTPAQQQKAKVLAKKARRRGTPLPTAEEQFVAEALSTALYSSGQLARYAMRWIANLTEKPTDQYRCFAKKLLELVENV